MNSNSLNSLVEYTTYIKAQSGSWVDHIEVKEGIGRCKHASQNLQKPPNRIPGHIIPQPFIHGPNPRYFTHQPANKQDHVATT